MTDLSQFLKDFRSYCIREFPFFELGLSHSSLTPNFINPFVVKLPKSHFDTVQEIATALHELRNSSKYRAHIQSIYPNLGPDPGNEGVFLGLDFYLTPQGLRLLEINTNAAACVIVTLLNAYSQNQGADLMFLRQMFESELSLSHAKNKSGAWVILDENPEQQRNYFEFLLFRSLFESWGYSANIMNSATFQADGVSLIYNRDCDFFLNSPEKKSLKNAYETHRICLTPNPYEYAVMSDKANLTLFAKPDFLEEMGLSSEKANCIRSAIGPVLDAKAQDPDTLWANRRKLFFKPTESYGSKGVYKGDGISKKVFDRILNSDYIAQEYFSAPVTESGFKYDLRFYCYQGRIQQVGARLFQGQVMNFQTPSGGFSAVVF